VDALERAAGELHRRAPPQQAPGRRQVERLKPPHVHALGLSQCKPRGRDGADRGRPLRHHQPDVTREPARAELDHACARAVEPLEVVDREHQRTSVRHLLDYRQRGGGYRAWIGGLGARVVAPQRAVERLALRVWQDARHLGVDLAEQVREGGVGESRLGRTGGAGEQLHAALVRKVGRHAQERGLADAGLALQHERRGPLGHCAQEALDGAEFLCASEHISMHVSDHLRT
jgi:hypothetical protein